MKHINIFRPRFNCPSITWCGTTQFSMLITPTNEPPLDPTNIISSFLRTLRGKLTPPDLTQIHPTGFRFPPSSTTHRFTVQSRPRMTWSPSKGSQRLWGTMWLCFTQRFNAFASKIGTMSHASDKIQLVGRMASPNPPKVFAKSFYHLEGTPHILWSPT